MTGIKETSEVLSALKLLADDAKDIVTAGHPSFGDFSKLAPAFAAIKAAKEGSNLIGSELADLDKAELAEIVGRLMEIAEEVWGMIPKSK